MERAASGVWNGLSWVTKSIVKPWQKHHHHHHHDHGPQDRRLGFTATQRKRIAAVVLLSYLCYPGVVLAQAVGTNVEAATGSAHAPQITQSQNKTTVVNINQASAGGVSRNQFNQFNVGPNGLILNNSTAITQTQLAGYIDGNAALKGRSARIILNEVVSANPSQLRGYTEIAGQRAEFILANPNGISCNGCGFINTTRSTLTTGTAQFNGNGGLTGFRVEGGQIAIEGQGLNASNVDQLDLLARTIRINGELWAQQLNLVTGRNTVDATTLAATPLADAEGANPNQTGIALDVSAIGGMYANVIRMVGTEKGFGVNSQGQMIADKDFTLAADGRITHGGAMNAGGKLTVSTQDVLDNQGFIGGGQVSLTARTVDNSAQAVLLADRQLNITAQERFSNEGGVQATDIAVQAGQMRNGARGILFAENILRIDSAGTVDNQGALIAGGTVGALGLKARSFNNTAGGVLLSFGDADIVVEETLLNESSTIEADGDLKLQATNIRNTREAFAVQKRVTVNKYNIAIPKYGKYKSASRSYTETITTHQVTANSAAGQILSGGDLTLLGSVDNIYSTISAGGDLHVEGAVLNNQDYTVVDSNVHSGTDSLNYDQRYCKHKVAGKCVDHSTRTRTDTVGYSAINNTQLTLADATISAGQDLTGQVGELKNGMRIDALAQPQAPDAPDGGSALPNWALGDAGYKLPTSGLVKPSDAPNGAYLVETDPRLTSYKAFISSDYMLSRMDYDPSITVKRLGDGFVEQRLVRDQVLSQTGQQNLAGFTDLEQQYVWLMQNAVSQSESLSLSMGIALSPEQISLLQTPIVWMVWETFETAHGPEKALVPKVYLGNLGDGTDMQLRPDGALVAAGGAMSLTVAGKLENNGSLQAGSLQVDAGELLNKGDIRAEGSMALSTEGDLVNQGGVIVAGGALGLEIGGDLVNETEAQRVETRQQTRKRSGLGKVSQGPDLVQVQTLVGREASIRGGSVDINAAGDVRMTGAQLSATDAQGQLKVQAGGDITIQALETVTSNNSRNNRVSETEQLTSQIQAGGDVTLQAGGKLLSEGTSFQAGGNLTLAAQGDVTLAAVNSQSEGYHHLDRGLSGATTEQYSRNTVTGNDLSAGGNLTIRSGGDLVSTASSLQAGQTLALGAEGDVLLMAATERDYSYEEKLKRSDGWGSSSGKTTRTEETLTTVGNQLSGENIQIQSGALVHAHASTLQAEGDITIQAENIALTAGIDQTYERETKVTKSTFKVKSQDKGSMEQTAVATELSGANISLQATGGVQITASNLNAEENLAIGNVAVQQQADGSFKAVNGEGTPENLIVDTLALKSESWNEKSEGYRGIAADLMKGIAVAAGVVAQGMGQQAPEIKLGSSSGQKTSATTQQGSSLSAGEQLLLAAKDNVTLIGADVSTEGTAVLSGKNVTLEAAAETRSSESSHSEHTVGGLGSKLKKDELSLGGMQEVKTTETTRTTETTHKGTTLNAGNLAVLATQDVNIVASNVKVEQNAIVQAGGDVNVTGKQNTSSTETRTEVETTTVAVGVRNAYVDTALAVKAAKEAYEAAQEADRAYDEAKKRVDSGELAKAALDDYKTNRDMARASAAQAEIAAAAALKGAAVAASQSGGTGFYVSGSAQKETTTTSATQTASTWQGSSIDAGNLSISGQNTTIEGSDITAGWLKLDSDNVLITAGINQYKTETSSSTQSVSASGGSNGSASASASTSSSKSSSTSLENVNSRINVGHLESDADSLTLRGAEVQANTADLNVGSLVVQSLQDTSSSSNSSKSTSAGAGFGSGGISSVNGGFSNGKGSSEAQEVGRQTQLLIADGANSQITAKDTTLIGGLIANATKNEDGTLTDHGQLNLTTETLTVSDLQDRSKSDQRSTGMQVSTGVTVEQNGNIDFAPSGTTTINLSHSGHKKEGETQATLGQGNIKVGGTDLSEQEQYADLNRNVNEGQITTLDQQTAGLNASVSVDNRWLTSSGRESLLNDQKDLGKNSAMTAAGALTDVARVGAAATAAVTDPGQIGNAWNTVGKGQDLAYANKGQLAGETENLRDGRTKDAHTAQDTTNRVDQLINGGNGERVKMTDGTWAYGAVDESGKTIYVDMEGNRLNSVVNTVAHEGMHAKGANEATATVTGYMTDLAYQVNAWANSEQIDANRPAHVATNSAASQQLLMKNNAAFMEQAKQGELEYRELHDKEIAHIKANSQAFADSLGIDVKTAEARLLVTAYSQVDKAYSEQHAKGDPNAQDYLRKISKVVDMDGEAIMTFAPMGYYEDSGKFSDQNGYAAERELLEKQPIFTQAEKNQKIREQVVETIVDGSAKGVVNAGIDAIAAIPETAAAIAGSDWQLIDRVPYANEVEAQVGQDVAGAAGFVTGFLGLFGLGKITSKPSPIGGTDVPEVKPGSFSIVDWEGYPASVPKPEGPFRLLDGSEYNTARNAANTANNAIRRDQGLVGQPVDVHEVQPVKFGGSPTDPANKVVIPRDVHRQEVTPWWNQLMRNITGP